MIPLDNTYRLLVGRAKESPDWLNSEKLRKAAQCAPQSSSLFLAGIWYSRQSEQKAVSANLQMAAHPGCACTLAQPSNIHKPQHGRALQLTGLCQVLLPGPARLPGCDDGERPLPGLQRHSGPGPVQTAGGEGEGRDGGAAGVPDRASPTPG